MERSALFWPEGQRKSVGRRGSIMKAPSIRAVRCAVYTRVSTEYGLDQESVAERSRPSEGSQDDGGSSDGREIGRGLSDVSGSCNHPLRSAGRGDKSWFQSPQWAAGAPRFCVLLCAIGAVGFSRDPAAPLPPAAEW